MAKAECLLLAAVTVAITVSVAVTVTAGGNALADIIEGTADDMQMAIPRDIVNASLSNIYADSEGYVVDVYENGIHLRGRDFVKDEFLPIASYWLNTTLLQIPAGTYKDSSGIITT